MPKVYFRTADSKAIAKEIDNEVNYSKALESIAKRFKLPKENIRLVYNGQTRTGNFKLNDDIPHHIVHVADKSAVGHEEIKVSLTVNQGKNARKINNVSAKSNTPVKDFINSLFESNKINKDKVSPESVEVYHNGVRLNDDETLLEKGVENNANLNILLRGDSENVLLQDYADSSNVP